MKKRALETVQIPYAGKTHAFQIPAHRLGEVVVPNRLPAFEDIAEVTAQALSRPVGSPPLEKLARPGLKAAVIVDDISRPTPTADMLPVVLDRLHMAGMEREAISIVVALGSHRPMTRKELAVKIGSELARDYRVINDSCQDREAMRVIGCSSDGNPVEANRWVVEADLRIGIGAIVPHLDTGFSGGGKIVLPGVCSCRSVNAFHARSADIPGNHLGDPEAPSRLRLEAFVSQWIPLDFIVNAVLHPHGCLYRCVAGHFIEAHRAGVEHARQLYEVPVKKRYPVVIANAHPFEIDFWQAGKAFWSGERMAADNGLVVMVAPCPEGTATHPLWAEYLAWELDDLKELLARGQAADPNACAFAVMFGEMRKRVRFGVVAPTLSRESVCKMGMTPFDDVEQAVSASAVDAIDNSVAVLSHGGTTVPIPVS